MTTTAWSTRLLQLCIGIAYLLVVTYAWATPGSQAWQLPAFDRIYVKGNLMLELRQQVLSGEQATARANGQSHLLQGLLVEVVDDVLYLDAQHITDPSLLQVEVRFATIKEIVLDGHGVIVAPDLVVGDLVLEGVGAGAFDLSNLHVDDLVVVGTGVTQFHVSGQALHQHIALAGNGEYLGHQLQSMTSEVSVRGQGDVNVWADEVLDIDVHGSAEVRYSGAAQVHRRIFGSGAITRVPGLGVTAL